MGCENLRRPVGRTPPAECLEVENADAALVEQARHHADAVAQVVEGFGIADRTEHSEHRLAPGNGVVQPRCPKLVAERARLPFIE
jgi:hypothetical protein